MRSTNEIKTEEKIIESDEISEYQKMGWRWKGELSDGRFIMELKIRPVPSEKKMKKISKNISEMSSTTHPT